MRMHVNTYFIYYQIKIFYMFLFMLAGGIWSKELVLETNELNSTSNLNLFTNGFNFRHIFKKNSLRQDISKLKTKTISSLFIQFSNENPTSQRFDDVLSAYNNNEPKGMQVKLTHLLYLNASNNTFSPTIYPTGLATTSNYLNEPSLPPTNQPTVTHTPRATSVSNNIGIIAAIVIGLFAIVVFILSLSGYFRSRMPIFLHRFAVIIPEDFLHRFLTSTAQINAISNLSEHGEREIHVV